MANIRQLKEGDDVTVFYPQTHVKAVIDSEGNTLDEILENLEPAGVEEAVKFTPQTLTTAQKTQARTNIGAGTYSKASTGIPASDMASAVQTSLGKADSAYQKPSGGIPKTDLASAVQGSLDLADSAIQSQPIGSITPPVDPSEYATAEELSQLDQKVTTLLVGGTADIERSSRATGKVLYINGNLIDTPSSISVVDTFSVDGGKAYKVSGRVGSAYPNGCLLAFYDSNGAYISGTAKNQATSSSVPYTDVDVVAPVNAKYIKVAGNSDASYPNAPALKVVVDSIYNEVEAVGLSTGANTESDLDLKDESGNVLARFAFGGLRTKYFNSIPFAGGKMSVLGDSISTFGGSIDPSDPTDTENERVSDGTYTYAGNLCRYPQANLLTNVNDTYWMRLMHALGMSLGVNDSIRGSRVSWDGTTESAIIGEDKYIGSQTRIDHLGENGTPDLILVYAGTNDAIGNVTLGTFNTDNPGGYDAETIAALPVNTFADAYRTLLIRLLYTYRTSKIVVCLPNFTTSTYYGAGRLDDYVEVIKTACDYFGVQYVDLRTAGISVYNLATYLGDGVHPNAKGMDLLYKLIYKSIIF